MYSNGDVLVNMCCYGEGRHSAVYGARIPVTAYVSVGSGVFSRHMTVTKGPGGNGVTTKYGYVRGKSWEHHELSNEQWSNMKKSVATRAALNQV